MNAAEFEPLIYNNLGGLRDADTRRRIVKDEFKQVGSHILLRKGVIQLTGSKYS